MYIFCHTLIHGIDTNLIIHDIISPFLQFPPPLARCPASILYTGSNDIDTNAETPYDAAGVDARG